MFRLNKALYRPKRRYLVISEFITACLEEDTLLDEDCGYSLSERHISR